MKKLTCILMFFACATLKAQQSPALVNPGPKAIINALDSFRNHLPIEKLYLQTDKPNYVQGDTLHFKSYLLNADYLTPSTKSGLLYIELDDINNQMIKRIMVQVTSGISRGDMVLNEGDVPEGSYTLRAYTNWMRNFGEDYVFKKNIYISAFSDPALLKAGFKADSPAGKNQTGVASLTKTTRMGRPEKMDVQFMPEGGNLVAGISTKIGFKAIGEDGRGADIAGKIINSKNQTIANIQTLHKGMGSFELTPEANETYTAVINLTNKTTKSYTLPKVNPTGTAIRITPEGYDSLEIVLSLKSGVESPKSALTQDSGLKTPDLNTYYLIGQSRGVVCYAAAIKFTTQTINKTISKALFPTGITRFTLLNQNDLPLNERIVYIDHHDNLNITVNTNKLNYTSRDSVALNIEVKDKDNNPVHGTFSLAVTDNSQVKPDAAGSNIVNDLLFTSDMKGNIEEPGWYFDPDSYRDNQNNKTVALDNLLLTQGWMGYDWKQVFGPATPPQYQNEKEFTVQGKVTNVFGKGIEQSHVLLMGKTPVVLRDTMTDKDGIFTFKKLFPVDTAEFKLQATNKNSKAFNVGITMLNDFTPPVFTTVLQQPLPRYINSDTTVSDTSLLNNGIKATPLQAGADYKAKGHLLREVEIKDKKIIPDSHNKNGPGEADETLTENEIKQIKPQKTLRELLMQKFKSFRKTVMTHLYIDAETGRMSFRSSRKNLLYGHQVTLFMDGRWAPLDMLDILQAEDIKGIEIMRTAKYAIAYDPNFISKALVKQTDNNTIEFAYEDDVPIILEITTYSGHGRYLTSVAGTYIYRPVPFTLPMAFYRPRYTVKNLNIAAGTDLRSTIHWEPNVITDKNGKATVSFFSADKRSDYTVIMEGTDLNGNLGYKRRQINGVSAAGK